MKKAYLVSIAIASVTMATATVFQNCSADAFGVRSSFDLPSDHPAVDALSTSQVAAKAKIGDLRYVESVMMDAFTSASSTDEEKRLLRVYMYGGLLNPSRPELVTVGELSGSMHLYGRSCDINETATFNDCNALATNANLAMDPATSSGREAVRIQLCRDLVNEPSLMARVLRKIQGSATTPNATAINAAIRLFYPNLDDASLSSVQTKLSAADVDMAKGAETTADRWKVLVLTVCESAGWEAL